MIGIIGAMEEEISQLKSILKNPEIISIAKMTFHKGLLNNKTVILVKSGVGKVNAAACSTILIEHFKVKKIIFTGVAGGIDPSVDIGDIIISTSLIHHDMDITGLGLKHGEIMFMDEHNFQADETLIKLAQKSALKIFDKEKVKLGIIVSGDQFINSNEKFHWLFKTFNAKATEMEGSAMAHVCYLYDIPFVVIRAISDKADSDAHINFNEFVEISARNAKIIVSEMVKEL